MKIVLSGYVKLSIDIKRNLSRAGYSLCDIMEMSMIYYIYHTMNVTLDDSALDKYKIFTSYCHCVRESDIELRGSLYTSLRRSVSRYEILNNITYVNSRFMEVDLC